MTPSQRTFLAFHVTHQVERWKWHFLNTQLRAHAGRRSATIWADELAGLLEAGLLVNGQGCADVHATELGREACK